MGSMIEAAWVGGITNAINGTASNVSPPNPPLDMPVKITAHPDNTQNKTDCSIGTALKDLRLKGKISFPFSVRI